MARYLAMGLIETRGLVGCIEAADAAAKTAEIYTIQLEHVGGGLVCIRYVGETAAVQEATRAGAAAAARVGHLISSHVIPRLDEETVRLLGLPPANPPPANPPPASPPPAGTPPANPPPADPPPATAGGTTAAGLQAQYQAVSTGLQAEYHAMSTVALRALARSIPDFPVRGRDLNRLKKAELIAALLRHGTGRKGHE